jgi:hypothetical protein
VSTTTIIHPEVIGEVDAEIPLDPPEWEKVVGTPLEELRAAVEEYYAKIYNLDFVKVEVHRVRRRPSDQTLVTYHRVLKR